MSSSFCKSDCQSKIHSDEATYVWTIEDFYSHEAKGETLISPPFSSVKNNQVKWYLGLQPNGVTNVKDSISLYYLSDENKEEAKRSLINIREFRHPKIKKSTGSIGWGFAEFIKKDENFRNKLLLNNTLTIRCEVKFSDTNGITTSTSFLQCNCGIEMPCDLSENIASLFENQTLTDVILSVNGKEYPAHKVILAARSPVFCAMFKHNTKENELNRVDINDINEAVVEAMLKYIYTGKCNDSDELVEGLLVAADKYDLRRLKSMCAKRLINRLSAESAANVLILADMHHLEDLKREAINFIVANFAQVLNTVGWKNMLVSNPHLVNDICHPVARE
ncbi:speckle-type POZ protein-like [Planococcus citri]|uniref:speckle-type POZ protein-like n=1 Tax=Planococcus citri TaxID=170843 RepID=UPI0031F892F5